MLIIVQTDNFNQISPTILLLQKKSQAHQQLVGKTFQTLPAYPPSFQPNFIRENLNSSNYASISTNWQPYYHHQQSYLSTGLPTNNWNGYDQATLEMWGTAHETMREAMFEGKETYTFYYSLLVKWWWSA